MIRVGIRYRQRITKDASGFLDVTLCFRRFRLALPGSHSKFTISSYRAAAQGSIQFATDGDLPEGRRTTGQNVLLVAESGGGIDAGRAPGGHPGREGRDQQEHGHHGSERCRVGGFNAD
jgi:hypothetical protein